MIFYIISVVHYSEFFIEDFFGNTWHRDAVDDFFNIDQRFNLFELLLRLYTFYINSLNINLEIILFTYAMYWFHFILITLFNVNSFPHKIW